MNARPERDRFLHRQARVQRGIAILEHHLYLPAVISQRQRAADRFAIEKHFALIPFDQLHQQSRRCRLAAAAFADHAECLTLQNVEVDPVNGADHLLRLEQPAAFDGKMFQERFDGDQRLCRAATVARICRGQREGIHHDFTSIAARSPSEKRLKQIEVMKIITPGSAAT